MYSAKHALDLRGRGPKGRAMSWLAQGLTSTDSSQAEEEEACANRSHGGATEPSLAEHGGEEYAQERRNQQDDRANAGQEPIAQAHVRGFLFCCTARDFRHGRSGYAFFLARERR